MHKIQYRLNRIDLGYMAAAAVWTLFHVYILIKESIEIYNTLDKFDFLGEGAASAALQEMIVDAALTWALGMAGIIGMWLIGMQLRRFNKRAVDRRDRAPHRTNGPT